MEVLLLQVISITLWISLCTWVSVFTAMMLLVPYIPFMASLRENQINGIASLAAMLMVARSPASAVSTLLPQTMTFAAPYVMRNQPSVGKPKAALQAASAALVDLFILSCISEFWSPKPVEQAMASLSYS